MSHFLNNAPEDIRVNVVLPKPKDFKVLAMSNPLFVDNDTDKKYEERISPHLKRINHQEMILSRDKGSLMFEYEKLMAAQEVVRHDGQRVLNLFHNTSNRRAQEALDLFQEFSKTKSHYVFDIETFGDSQDRKNPYGISEISLNKYNAAGGLVSEGYNGVIRQDEDVLKALGARINELAGDKYKYNGLQEWEKRSLVDLMRFATYKEDSDKNAFSMTGEMKHHSIIDSVFDDKDRVDHGKVIREMDMYLKYMRSGLETIASKGDSPKQAMEKVAKIMADNQDDFFLSYNGNSFDMPVLKAYAEKLGVKWPEKVKHLDWLILIKSTHLDSDVLKRKVNPEYAGTQYGKDKQAAWVKDVLGIEDQGFHNAKIDVDNLAKVVAATRDPLGTSIENAKVPLREGFNYHPTHMTWNGDSELRTGQTLFTTGGIQAYADGEESFSMRLDENGKWVPVSNGFNKTVINSKTFYQFAGHEVLEDGKQVFRFYDPETKEISNIIRKGEHAFQELTDFVQSRFYNWDNVDPQQKREIRHAAETDRARRRYDRFFGLDGGGKGLTVIDGKVTETGTMGFSGLKRMLENLDVMEMHLNSHGAEYRKRVEELRASGMSAAQAKAEARMIRSHELIGQMNFNSLWDDKQKKYVFNTAEKDQFFKMYNRLFDERDHWKKAVANIDEAFKGDIDKALAKGDDNEVRNALKLVNQQRDQALMRYYQQVTDFAGTPTQPVDLKEFESQRIPYFDPEAKDTRTLNFESPSSAQRSLYGYAKRGVGDSPNRNEVMRERMGNLLGNLRSQSIVSDDQYKQYMSVLANTDSVYNASGEIAFDMRNKSGGKYESKREAPAMHFNDKIQSVTPAINESFIQKAIADTQNAQMLFQMDAIKGSRLEISEGLRRQLDVLDQQRFSRLNPQNYAALEELLTSMKQNGYNKQFTLAMDQGSSGVMKVFAYNPKDSISVNNQLQRGVTPTQALEINMPLINEAGTHAVGGMVLNAHSVAVYDEGNVKMISSAQQIARGYAANMRKIMKAANDGDYDRANTLARRTLRNEVERMSGIQRNMEGGENDTYKWANNTSDDRKQAHVKMANAMIEDMFYSEKGYDGIKLTMDDFYDWGEVGYTDASTGKPKLRRGVTLDDVKGDTSYKILMKMPKWAEDKLGEKFYTSGLKAEQVAKGTMSMEDARQIRPYGSFYNHGRDNLVQYENAFLLNPDVQEGIDRTEGVSRSSLIATPRQIEEEAIRANQTSFNMKTAYMTQDELRAKVNGMMETEDGKNLLNNLGFLDDEGKLYHEKLPRLYEQQGIIAQDVADMLEVDNEKRFAKGLQFEVADGLKLGQTIQPGTRLGWKTHDNGAREEIVYQGNKEARIIQGITGTDDLVVQWKSDPFKIMLDGEKMTDSPVDRRFIEALTGRSDIAAIINPDVAKHQDFGMLMSGEARYMAEEVGKLTGALQKQAIDIIESGGIGLKWDAKRNRFIDNSFGMEIERDAFKNTFAALKEKGIEINPVTDKGVRFGVLEAHLSKVSNYSRVVDDSGKAVLGFKSDGSPIYGKEGGVQWGHREMGVLKSYGRTAGVSMDKTYEHVYQTMLDKSKRLGEAIGVKESLRYIAEDVGAEVMGLDATDFKSLPEMHRNLLVEDGEVIGGSYKGTIFDQDAVHQMAQGMEERHGPNAKGIMNQHGFWLNLPSVERTDKKEGKITVQSGRNTRKEIDRIFIPFTKMDDTNGDVHLRDLQRHIGNIYEKAAAVTNATSIDEARAAHSDLQRAANQYVKQSFKELTSSKGMMLGEVFKTSMDTSASGLFKLMDFDTSQKFMERYGAGQYTVISEDMAQKMGVFDKLKNGEELFTANVRYPTFHDGAMQFTKLKMADWVKEGEIHTTSFSSMLQNADSDGDYSHIVVVDDKGVQEEWKQAHDATERKFQDRWEAHRAKEDPSLPGYKSQRGVSIHETAPKTEIVNGKEVPIKHIPSNIGNSDEEMAAKIGKMTIGRASNLNLFIRQAADKHFDGDVRNQMLEFGRGLEQKLIDAKHGAKPAGLEMIDAIYAGDWNRAKDIDNNYFDSRFQNDFHMNTVAQEMPSAIKTMREGLRTQGFKFGTSTGINTNFGIDNLMAVLHGTADPSEYGGDNKALAMMQRYLRDSGMDIPEGGTPEMTAPYERHSSPSMMERADTRGWMNKAKTLASDSIGGGVSDLKGKVGELWDSLKGMSGKKKAIALGSLAVGGIAGYNILSTDKPEMHYMNEPELPSGQEQVNPRRQPQPALEMPSDYSSTHNASVSISATGRGMGQDQMSAAVTQGMQDTGMNAGPTRVSVTTRDNTQQLNRQWYRDKVRENI